MMSTLVLDLRRIVRRREAWAAIVGGAALLVIGALVERASTPPGETRDTFGRPAFPILLSLFALAITQGISGGAMPTATSRLFFRTGARIAPATLGTLLVSTLFSLILFPLVGAATLFLTRDVLPAERATVVGILALVAPAYAAFYGVAFSFGARGASLFFFAEYILGSTGGTLALLFPRSHLRNLLGSAPPFGVSPFTSSLFLVALPLFYTSLLLIRARRVAFDVPPEPPR